MFSEDFDRAVAPVLQIARRHLHIAHIACVPHGQPPPVVCLPLFELAATALQHIDHAEIAVANTETVKTQQTVVLLTYQDIAPYNVRPLLRLCPIHFAMQVDCYGIGIDSIVGLQLDRFERFDKQHIIAIDETERVGAERQVVQYAFYKPFALIFRQAIGGYKVCPVRTVRSVLLNLRLVGKMPIDLRQVVRNTSRRGIILPSVAR